MEPNPYRRLANRWWIASAVSLLAGVGLWQAHEAGWRTFLVFIGAVWGFCGCFIAGLVAVFVGRTIGAYDRLVTGGARVQWTCGDAEWRAFRELDARETLAKQQDVRWVPWLFLVLFVGAAAAVVAEKSSQWDLGLFFVGLGVALFVFFRVLFGQARARATREEPPSTVYIGDDGFVFRGQYVGWRRFGTSLAGLAVDLPNHVLRVTIRVRTQHGHNDIETRLPIPGGREREAEALVHALAG